MILRPVSPQSPCGPARDELAGRIDVVVDFAVHKFGRQHRIDDLVDHELFDLLLFDLGVMLRRDDDRVDADGRRRRRIRS